MSSVTVDSKWLASNLDDPNLIIIDARPLAPYRFGHIKNALHLGIEMVIRLAGNGANLAIDSPAAEKVFGSLGMDDSKKVVVYGEQDDPSAGVAWSVVYHRHPDVKMLDIGFQAWRHAGLPVTRDIPQPKPAPFKSKPTEDIRIDAEMIKKKMGNPSFVVVDARTPMQHMQARIPDSILHDWEQGVGANGVVFAAEQDLRQELEGKGVTTDKEAVCYCHSGTRDYHKYMQLKHAGYQNVRPYDGSIIDWAQKRNPLK